MSTKKKDTVSASKNGGGIYNHSDINGGSFFSGENHLLGNLTLTKSVVSDNNAGDSGGGIATFAGVINRTDSTIADNTAVNNDRLFFMRSPALSYQIIFRNTLAEKLILSLVNKSCPSTDKKKPENIRTNEYNKESF